MAYQSYGDFKTQYLSNNQTPAPKVGRPGLLGRFFKGTVNAIGAVDRSFTAGVGHFVSPITAPVISSIQRSNPGKFNVQAPNANDIFTNRVSPQLKAKAQASMESFDPGSAFKQANQAATLVGKSGFSGALEQSGALKTSTGGWGTARNIALDFALDPLNFLTMGIGSGAKIANLAGKEMTLTKAGTSLYKTAISDLVKASGKDFLKLGEKEIANIGRQAELKVASLAEKTPGLIDQGGIKFAGKTMVPGEISTKPLGKLVQAGFDKVGANKVFGPGARDKLLSNNLLAKRTFQAYRDTLDAANARFADLLNPTLKGLSKADLEAATMVRVGGLEATGKLKPVLELTEKTLSAMGKDLKQRGLIVGMLDHYLPLIAKDPTQVINGVTLNEFFNRMGTKFAFGNPRKIKDTLEAISQAKAAGYDVQTNIGELLKAYVTAANKSIGTQELYKNLAKDFGVSKNVFMGGTEPTKNATFKFNAQPGAVAGKTEPTFLPIKNQLLPGGGLPSPELTQGARITFKGTPAEQTAQRTLSASENMTTPTLQSVPNTKGVSLTGDALVPVAGARGLEDVLLPKFIADYLGAMGKESHNVAPIVRSYDALLNTFRKFFTAMPAYHFRNEITNTLQNVLDVGLLKAVNPRYHANAFALMSGKNLGKTVEFGGQRYTVGQLRTIMQDNGVLQGVGFFETTGNIGTGLSATSRRVGRFIENRSRAVNFLANLEKTGSIQTAAEHVKHFLFDYSNLSQFEQNVVRRVFLFPTWTSRNFLLQLEQASKKPGFFSKYGILQSDLNKNRSNSDQALVPDYLTQDINIPFGKDAQGNPRTLTTIQSPLSAAAKMLDPQNALGALVPPAKIGLEVATGRNFFTGKTIAEGGKSAGAISFLKNTPPEVQKLFGFQAAPKVDSSGKPTGDNSYTANPWAVYIAGSIPTSGLSTAASSLSDTSVPLAQRLIKFVSGTKISTTYVSSAISQQAKEYGLELAKDFLGRGYISQGQNGYYVSPYVQLPADQKQKADELTSLLNNKGNLTNQYLQSIGANPTDFPSVTSGSSSTKKITNKQMAALLAYQNGQPEIAAKILFPNAFKFTKGGTTTKGASLKKIKVKVPSSKLSRKTPKATLKAKTPKRFRFVSKTTRFKLGR